MSKFDQRGVAQIDARKRASFARLTPEIEPGTLYRVYTDAAGVIKLVPIPEKG